MTRVDRLILRVLVLAFCATVAAFILITEGGRPTFGPVPTTILDNGERVDLPAQAPDYIPVADPYSEGIAGWVRYEDLDTSDGRLPVVDFWLHVEGYLVPGRGFVPVGE